MEIGVGFEKGNRNGNDGDHDFECEGSDDVEVGVDFEEGCGHDLGMHHQKLWYGHDLQMQKLWYRHEQKQKQQRQERGHVVA